MPGIPNYFEIGTPDPEGARRFYGSLFDWDFGKPSPLGYGMVNGGEGGLWDTSSVGGGSWAVFYGQVDDVEAAIESATSLGASIALPHVDNGSIEFAHLLDPSGNRFGIWRPKRT
ncbi:VOC family protein [Paeniglutamicibacter sp. R2-26]|uniref:VOC family protein n=1 Tax=Paeniglutamicibacter sp. R2-26 TaxID=3144417 RepID=UPI003EE4BC41